MAKSALKPFPKHNSKDHKVLVVVLDGIGHRDQDTNITRQLESGKDGILPDAAFRHGNAVNASYTPSFSRVFQGPLFRTLRAHGKSVGLPSDEDMGNSEVGHNALGAGRVFAQGAKLINEAIASGSLFKGAGWKTLVERPELMNGKNTLHFLGLLSDGNVHSHISHLFALIEGAKKSGVKKICLHMLLDGRDVPPTSALEYVQQLEDFLSKVCSKDFQCKVASGGGRMFVTMDRYESDWSIVERGYKAHVLGEAPHTFGSLREAVEGLRKSGGYTDQNLPPFVITENGKPVGQVVDGDSFVLFNFRGDRAIEISRALTEQDFKPFARGRFPKIQFAGMMQYDGDLKIPAVFLVDPPVIAETSGELLSAAGVKQFACSETQKFGHVTYFWNGNRSGKFNAELENYVEIPSDLVPFEQRPWMKSAEIADETIKQMRANSFRAGRINFANGDMVGHTGQFDSAMISVMATDIALGRILGAAKETKTIVIVTADHGNADEMYEIDKKTGKIVLGLDGKPKTKTSHTLTPVPFAIYNAEVLGVPVSLRDDLPDAGLANVASTVFELLGFTPPENYEPSLLAWEQKPKVQNSAPSKIINTKSMRTSDQNYKLAKASIAFADTVSALRSPTGCPWDKEQNFETLTSFMIEEAYEAVQAALSVVRGEKGALPEFCDELGDVLLQIFLNAQIADEAKQFTVESVFDSINEKMLRRHPHVFGEASAENSAQVLKQWDEIKAAEQKSTGPKSLMHKVSKKKALPTLSFAKAVAKRSYKLGFAWPTLEGVFGDLASEVEEFRHEIFQKNPDWAKVKDELGDIVYALGCVSAHLAERFDVELDPDIAGRAATEKFLTRFREMEEILKERGTPLTEESAKQIDLTTWEDLWKLAKKRRYQ